jgi:hypothetical protein
MDVRVSGAVSPAPFLAAKELFETEHDLEVPVHVEVQADPEERTWTGHYDDHHVLNISRSAASSAMARQLALHEYAHMRRYEEGHPSHHQSTREALYLALAGHSVEQRRLTHCYQIANHMKDIYADDITLAVAPADRLVRFLESRLAAAVADQPADQPDDGARLTATADPDMTAVNAAFALALVERHDLVDDDHRLYDLAHAADDDAETVSMDDYRERFRSLSTDTDERTYREQLVALTRNYAAHSGRAAD